MTSKEIRNQFLNFFKERGHKVVSSSSVIPFNDPTLLFTNAGMNQFKDVFLGIGKRDYKRAVDSQKCIRVSGKHNDLEEVGYDTYHHTFFEMLGNWSFGDYYKSEAIQWAWELLTDVWKLPKERLWATVFRTDDESYNLWAEKTDINLNHILRFDEKDNFWEMGEIGPCGPCSEIHINLSDDYENPKWVNAGKPECVEIWNLVFIQYNRDENGTLLELPQKHVDTGMGFERICAVLQSTKDEKKSNYDTDIFSPLIKKIEEISGIKYLKEENKIAMRVIADHIRALTFAISDGALPGNEGRGYVLRRILRRASRFGRKLNLKEPFIYKLVDTLAKTMGDVYPEIVEKKELTKKIIKSEEENFSNTLDKGIELFENIVQSLKEKNINKISGEEVFKLYDTYGFPIDLTRLMAKEINFEIDEEKFGQLMDEQKLRARESAREKLASINITVNDIDDFVTNEKIDTTFTGYNEFVSNSKIVGIKKEDHNDLIILDASPFYVEAGGQVDDTGKIVIDNIPFEVLDLAKIENKIVHIINNEIEFPIKLNQNVIAQIDEKRRLDIMRNHTATHFLHSALRKILGTHVHQAGSYVGPDRLRFDFAHYSKLSESEIMDIEALVNEELRNSYPLLHHRNIPFEQAQKMGALMFFGDKYGDYVNVVQYGEFTKEFCGGTHLMNSSQIGLFKILSESSISSGVRRIEAVTGLGVEKYIQSQIEKLKSSEEKIAELLETKKKLERELSDFRMKEKLNQIPKILENQSKIDGINIYKGKVEADNVDELKLFGDELRNKMKDGVGLLISEIDDKVNLVCVVSDSLIKEKKLNAGKIVGEVAKIVSGNGGGRPHLATAGGKDISKVNDALNQFDKIINQYLKN
ncbi:MAG: alanine--tRNA ligase [Ignavibacterium sp.]